MAQAFQHFGYISPQARNFYRDTEIKTADGLELVLILYRGAAEQLRQARSHLAAGRIPQRAAALTKAMAMIGELQACLNQDKGGEIAASLDRLYTYMIRRLTEANIRRDVTPIDEVLKLLGILESAWLDVQNQPSVDRVAGIA
jgi:flagellar secretion chaperone FliS